MKIKNIIFDLGGVLLNIDYHATIDAFKGLGVTNFDTFFTQANQNHLFDRLDKGQVSADEFRDEMRQISRLDLSNAQIDQAWNAMLLDLPAERITLLEQVKSNYQTYLLSNTNSIHYPSYIDYLQKTYGYKSLAGMFHDHYLSHEIGMRKPDKEIFSFVLHENFLNPLETLFIDDTLQHVQGARRAGLWAYWLDLNKENISDLFEEGKLSNDFVAMLQNQQQGSLQ